MDVEGSFSVERWLRAHPAAAFGSPLADVPQMAELKWCWTSTAAAADFAAGQTPLQLSAPPPPFALAGTYVAKDEAKKPAVETVLRAARAAGVDVRGFSRASTSVFLTFRSNLNKLIGTTMDLKTGWTVDACVLPSCPTLCLMDTVKPAPSEWEASEESRRLASFGRCDAHRVCHRTCPSAPCAPVTGGSDPCPSNDLNLAVRCGTVRTSRVALPAYPV